MTATAACFWLRPVANAFGTSLSITATRGLRRSAIAQRRSIISCSSGAWSGSTTFAPEAFRASLSEVKYWTKASAADDHDHQHDAGVRARRTAPPRRRRRAAPATSRSAACAASTQRRDRKPCVSSRIGPLEGEKFPVDCSPGGRADRRGRPCDGGALRARSRDRRARLGAGLPLAPRPRTGCSSSARARRSAGAARSPRLLRGRDGERDRRRRRPRRQAADLALAPARRRSRSTSRCRRPGSTTTCAATRSRSPGPATAAC